MPFKDSYHIEDNNYAIDSSGEKVYIESIPIEKRGLACGCFCPKCKMPMIAKLGHDVPSGKKPHFAHKPGSNCHDAAMTIIHMQSINLIERHKVVMAPNYYSVPSRKLEFVKVEVEKREDRNDMQPDIVGITDDGKRWAIEIRNTHEIGEEKREKIIESGIACIEIDVREQSVETLEDFLFNQTVCRVWINNPYYDELFSKLNTGYSRETPVPDYIYNPRNYRGLKNDNYCLKIPNSCHSLYEYYLNLKSRKTFHIDGRRNYIIEVDYISDQLYIFHKDSSGLSYHYVTCVYANSEGEIFEDTKTCRRDEIPTILDAIKEGLET